MPEARSKVPKKAATKKAPKTTVSKKAPTKKTAVKKVTQPRKQAAKKTKVTSKTKVKTAAKTTTKQTKKTSAAKMKPKAKVSAISKKTKKQAKPKSAARDTVVVPNHMSIRAREKALVWAEHFEKKIHKPAYALTMTFGALFILFGSYSGLHYATLADSCVGSSCAAQLLSSTDDNSVDDVAAPEPPKVTMVDNLPPVIDGVERITLTTENVDEMEVYADYVTNNGQTGIKEFTSMNLLNGRYQVTIGSLGLESGIYTLRVKAYNQAQDKTALKLGVFEIEERQIARTIDLRDDQSNLDANPDSLIDVQQQIATSSATSSTKIINSDTNKVDDDTVTVDDVGSDAQSNDLIPAAQNDASDPSISISADSILTGNARITVKSNVNQFITFYLRRVQGTQVQQVGNLYVGSDSEMFTFNSLNFPNGDYKLTAQTTSVFDDTESNSLRVTIQNDTEPIAPAEPVTTPVVNEEREVLEITPDLLRIVQSEPAQPAPVREPVVENTVTNEESVETLETTNEDAADEPIKKRTLATLQADTDTLNDLFTRYAAAVQSGDPDMIREARNAISSYQRSVVDTALADPKDRFFADDIAESLDKEIQEIATKVETFETLRRERTEGEVSIDTDGDGITDTDERILFATDPLRADTDGDGFTDGAEIIKGFNPVDAASEAVIVYRSPKETVGIVANKNLQVIEVTPDIALPETEVDEQVVQTTVRGKALPNSFVTLYVFSTPTIVTVKTEADGSFEYTFSKELEDGEHQVFVALTDNTGDIVAQSEPFTFVKRAEAFTAVDAEAVVSDTQASGVTVSSLSAFQTVLSMSVLALGILLIMLGVGLRSNRPNLGNLEPAA